MGCGKQISSRNSANIVVVSSVLNRSQAQQVDLAAPIEVKNEVILTEPVEAKDEQNKNFFTRLDEPRGSQDHHAKDSLFEVSKISYLRDDNAHKYNTIRQRSPTEVVRKIEERNLGTEINFDFLNESSKLERKEKKEDESLDIEILN
jgi:hypothetical protein